MVQEEAGGSKSSQHQEQSRPTGSSPPERPRPMHPMPLHPMPMNEAMRKRPCAKGLTLKKSLMAVSLCCSGFGTTAQIWHSHRTAQRRAAQVQSRMSSGESLKAEKSGNQGPSGAVARRQSRRDLTLFEVLPQNGLQGLCWGLLKGHRRRKNHTQTLWGSGHRPPQEDKARLRSRVVLVSPGQALGPGR